MPFFATQFIFTSWPRRSLQITGPFPSASVITGFPTHSFARSPTTTKSRAYTFIMSSPVQRACRDKVTTQRAHPPSQSQSREYSMSASQFFEFRGIRPNRCAMNSSGRTEVLDSISTTSMATVGISARMVRRKELAKARSTELSRKSTRWLSACENAKAIS
jgi:hypothetical protein